MTSVAPATADILVVDDQEQVRVVLSRILAAGGYQVRTADSVAEALDVIDALVPDLILCDIDMPEENGLVLVKKMYETHPEVAILMVTAFDDPGMAETAMDEGALGYIIKPFERNEILINVAGVLRQRRQALEAKTTVDGLERAVEERTRQLQASLGELDQRAAALDRSHEEALRRMACAAEFRDPETACHLERMSRYAAVLARAAGLPEARCEMVRLAAPMHDVGKIGIPDDVLLKEGIFTDDDRRIMERHPVLGYELLTGSGSELLELAATMAYTHHEWFDGSGYPRHLSGTDIPIEGRIVAIADVFDALTSARRYKEAFSPEQAEALMREEIGSHFDPELVELFFERATELDHIRLAWSETHPDVAAVARVSVA